MSEPLMDPDEARLVMDEAVTKAHDIAEQTVQVHVDNVFPWYRTQRVPFFMMSLALAGMVVAVIMVVKILDRANQRAARRDEVQDCRNQYDSHIRDSQQDFNRWLGTMETNFDEALVLATEQPGVKIDTSRLTIPIPEVNRASVAWAAALNALNEWETAGAPLPCPADPAPVANGP